MPDLSRRVRMGAARIAVLALALSPAAASAQSTSDADLKAIQAHKLTMPKYKQYLDATINLAHAAAKDPSLGKRLDGFGNQSLADQVKTLESVPQVRGAITSTGITPRDYVLTQGALLQAAMATSLTRDAKMAPDEVAKRAGVSKANLEFYQQNETEIQRLAKEAEARAPKDAQASDEDDAGDEPAE